MRKKTGTLLILGAFILASTSFCYANGPGTTAASFLKIGIGARAAAMGEAFTALASDGTSLYWNPAGLTQLPAKEVSATYNSWLQEINQGYLSFSFPLATGALGLGVNYVEMGKMEGRDEYGSPTGDFTASDTHVFIGYATKFKTVAWGLSLGTLQDVIKEDRKTSFLANVGFLYPVGEFLTLGLAAQNIGSRLGADPLPLTFKIGAASKLRRLILALDVAKPQDSEIYCCFGAEWWLKGALAFRAGYKTNQDAGEGITAGLGLKMGKVSLDYAYVPYGDLGDTHRISLGIKF